MNYNIAQPERETQNRVVKLFVERLGYEYLGNWEYREDNSNVEVEYLKAFLERSGYSDNLIKKAINRLTRCVDRSHLGLFEVNKDTYSLLRYGAKEREELGEQSRTVHFIDWENPENNHFAIAEEVTVQGFHTKRPDLVIYVNGIALAVLELKRSTKSVQEGIRQNIGNQKEEFIQPFFATVQLITAGNDSEGLRYGTIETQEKYYVAWREEGDEPENKLDKYLLKLFGKDRLLEIIHDFVVFDYGRKKLCRHNQYFAVKSAQEFVKQGKSGIIWHTQGSGKSLTMVWLAKWIRENITDSRVLIITDRIELDEQIEGVFDGVDEAIYKTKSCRDLIEQLNIKEKWLICSLVHKFGKGRAEGEANIDAYLDDIQKSLPKNFEAKGNIFVFVDECHRTHGGKLHRAMKKLLPDATFIGFTGTPLLKVDKKSSLALFGPYIHTYKYDEAVTDEVVLDLKYEARRVAQDITSQDKIDEWFDERTKGLTDVARAELKKRWGTMQALLSSRSRLDKIVFDILDDFYKKPRLAEGRGNAMLVASSIHEACMYYDIFQSNMFSRCAVVTSYEPDALKTEEREYRIYQRMLNGMTTEDFEREVKEKFVKYPAQMQLLIVVDKLLTGFDAPPATYLYIDKNMKDHGLFQAVCRVNRLHTEDKMFGYIIDYRDLFKKLAQAVTDYTKGALDGFDQEDVIGLLKDRLVESKKELDGALETVRAVCEPVQPPKKMQEYIDFFCGDIEHPYDVKEHEKIRIHMYKAVSRLLWLYSDIANELGDMGFTEDQSKAIKREVEGYEKMRQVVKLASADYIDLKKYEPDMRILIDRYISAQECERLTTLGDKSLVDLLIEKGEVVTKELLPEAICDNKEAVAETVVNNVRRKIIDEMPTNPKYYSKMSELLTELIRKRKKEDLEYSEFMRNLIDLAKMVRDPEKSGEYPSSINTKGKQALFDNLDRDMDNALAVDKAIIDSREHKWRGHVLKERKVKMAISGVLPDLSKDELDSLFEIVKNNDY